MANVEHDLKKLPSLFAAVVVDDTQFQAVGHSQQVSKDLQRAIRLFTEHAEEVAGLVVSSKKLDVITNNERVRTDVRNNKVQAEALRTGARGTWRSTTLAAGNARAPRLWRCVQSGSG